ncbi:G-protein coupled receptor GRL101-like [Lineus longissimus]|uniref:G-protein coupled receptor GRL101-like n=1 Tax=Lineus longissimus TaxID=88925 RepID=UPI00315D3AAD
MGKPANVTIISILLSVFMCPAYGQTPPTPTVTRRNCTKEECGDCVNCQVLENFGKNDNFPRNETFDCSTAVPTYWEVEAKYVSFGQESVAGVELSVKEEVNLKGYCVNSTRKWKDAFTVAPTFYRTMSSNITIDCPTCSRKKRCNMLVRELRYRVPKKDPNYKCPEGWLQQDHLCYALYRNATTWNKANEHCESSNSKLVSILDGEELLNLKHFFTSFWWPVINETSFRSNEWIFIGLIGSGNRNPAEDPGEYANANFNWTDNHPATYFEWYQAVDDAIVDDLWQAVLSAYSQPTAIGTCKCGVMFVNYAVFKKSFWFKIPCSFPIECSAYICKKEAEEISRRGGKDNKTMELQGKIAENTSTTVLGGCGKGWTLYQRACYFMYTSTDRLNSGPTPEETLRKECTNQKADVAPIDNPNEKQIVLHLLKLWRHLKEYGPVLLLKEGKTIIYTVQNTREQADYIARLDEKYAKKYNVNVSKNQEPLRSVICTRLTETRLIMCKANQKKCNDGTCINPNFVCDNIPDCPDKSDEESCNTTHVRFKMFNCANNKTIPYSLTCDFINNCGDRSDETFCEHKPCDGAQFKCENGQCIHEAKRCDLNNDCVDRSDEKNCRTRDLKQKAFRCYSGKWIPNSMINDIYGDCPGIASEDELQDWSAHSLLRAMFTPKAKSKYLESKEDYFSFCPKPNEVRCKYEFTTCFRREDICAYDYDKFGVLTSCRDGSHLLDCKDFECPGKFKCNNSYCIPVRMRCDNTVDCPHGEDEVGCNNTACPPGFFRCRNGICLDQNEVCDERVHCNTYEDDETMCGDVITCPRLCTCRGLAIACTGAGSLENLTTLNSAARFLNVSNTHMKITPETFKSFHDLVYLDISHNDIIQLPPKIFENNPNLQHVDLSHNKLTNIVADTFLGLKNLKTLILVNNELTNLAKNGFQIISEPSNSSDQDHCFDVLDLRNNNFEVNPLEILELKLVCTKLLKMDRFDLCCAAERAVNCTPKGGVFSSCDDLMANDTLRYSIWVLGIMALLGNLFVLFWRLLHHKQGLGVENLLVTNLSIADFLMGVYLLIIGGVDVQFRGVFGVKQEMWMSHGLCYFAGIISLISSEISVFLLVFITADRVIAIVFAFKMEKVTLKQAAIVLTVAWIVVIGMALLPLLSMSKKGFFTNFYGSNAVCLPLSLGKNASDIYGVIILTLNLLAFIFIAIGYIAIYSVIRKSRKQMEHFGQKRDTSKEMVFVKRMCMVIASDFCCWVPIVIMKYLALGGMTIHPIVSAWTAVFVLPLNSSLNPFLYTIASLNASRGPGKGKGSKEKFQSTDSVETLNSHLELSKTKYSAPQDGKFPTTPSESPAKILDKC